MGIDLRIECDSCDASIIWHEAFDRDWDVRYDPRFLESEGWGLRLVCGRWKPTCPRCEAKATGLPTPAGRARMGFTLVELLVVMVIVSILAAVALPVVLGWARTKAVHSAAEGLQAAIVGAREAAAKDRSPKGLRIVPDASWALSRGPDGRIDPAKALAGGRAVPMEAGPAYSEGLVTIDLAPLPPGFARPTAVLMLEQSRVDRDGLLAAGTSWAWNVRVGDRIRIGGNQADYWVVGPEVVGPAGGNVERCVNYGPAGPDLDRGDGRGPREYLWLVNGRDDDGDGRVDPGFNGLDEDADGSIDSPAEWVEVEEWAPAHRAGLEAEPYQLFRRPVPSAGPSVELGAAVVDLTGWGLDAPPRSRAMVDPWTGAVELIVEPDGRVRPAIVASSPAALGLRGDWIHLWIADRSDVQDWPRLDGAARLLSIHGRTGRVAVTEIDPDDPAKAFTEAEGRR